MFFGLFSGVNHGFFEFLQGNKPTGGVHIYAIGEAQRFWPLAGEDAFTLIPNFMITGIVSMVVGLAIIIWSIWFLPGKHGRTVFLGLFILSFLVGGGIGQAFFFLPAWAFARRGAAGRCCMQTRAASHITQTHRHGRSAWLPCSPGLLLPWHAAPHHVHMCPPPCMSPKPHHTKPHAAGAAG